MKTIITNANIVNENHVTRGSLVVDGSLIERISPDGVPQTSGPAEVIDADGCYVMPGVIDEHVHLRQPGMEHKADIASESRAAACGGVTSFMDMPNTMPPVTNIERLEHKHEIAAATSRVNYSFHFGATNSNAKLFASLDRSRVPAVKLFMGSSTGNLLVDSKEALDDIFRLAPVPLLAHCEDTNIINANMKEARRRGWGADPDVCHHPWIRSEEACLASTTLAVGLARKHGTRLHVLHISTAKELELFGNDPRITAEACIAHLLFCDADYARLGTKIKCNPAIKSATDRDALRKALTDGRIMTVGTDHSPHLMSEKTGGCARAASGMPVIQFALPVMLSLVDDGVLSIERMVELMCHNPARLFAVRNRGFLREGYKADIVIVRRCGPWMVTPAMIQSKCGWSPLTDIALNWRVEHTLVNGRHIYNKGVLADSIRGEQLLFDH